MIAPYIRVEEVTCRDIDHELGLLPVANTTLGAAYLDGSLAQVNYSLYLKMMCKQVERCIAHLEWRVSELKRRGEL